MRRADWPQKASTNCHRVPQVTPNENQPEIHFLLTKTSRFVRTRPLSRARGHVHSRGIARSVIFGFTLLPSFRQGTQETPVGELPVCKVASDFALPSRGFY